MIPTFEDFFNLYVVVRMLYNLLRDGVLVSTQSMNDKEVETKHLRLLGLYEE